MIKVESLGSFDKTFLFLSGVNRKQLYTEQIEKWGQAGVELLRDVTPKDTGKTAASWKYKITWKNGKAELAWINDNLDSSGVPIVVLLINGHGTPSGYYVEGRDFVSPVMDPLIQNAADDIWKVVTGT